MAASMAVSAIEKFINDFDDSAYKEICQHLMKKDISLGEIAEQLGIYLTNKDTAVRARATRLLADILNNLPKDFLTQKEGSLLTVYLCERLRDHYSLQPHALYGLLAISTSRNIPNECVEKICRTIFKEVHCQSLPQGDRRTIFTIMSTFLTTKISELQNIGTDFVYGYIQVMDGEKDPRNLILAFQCARLVIENFPLGVFTEEMFEVVSCYFPIDFTPSENDPSGITKEDLISELRYCLAATPKFAQYCLPFLLEKLSSDLKSAKIDSLQTLAVCADVYGAGSLQEYESSFFKCIKKEIFLSGDPAVEEASLQALTALVKALSTGIVEVGTKRGLEGFVEEVLTEVKQHLLQPELMLMLSTGRLLGAAAQGSVTACCQILNTTLPMLIETYNRVKESSGSCGTDISDICCQILNTTLPMLIETYNRVKEYSPVLAPAGGAFVLADVLKKRIQALLLSQATPKYNVLQVLTRLLDSASNFSSSTQCLNTSLPYKIPLLEIFKTSLREDVPVIHQQAVEGFRALFAVSKLLSESDILSVTKVLILKVCEKDLDKDVRLKCNDLFKYTSTDQTEIVLKALMYAVFPLVNPDTAGQDDNKMKIDTDEPANQKVEADEMTNQEMKEVEFVPVTPEEKSKLLTKNISILETLSAVCTRVDIVRTVTRFLLEYLYCSKDCSVEIHQDIFYCFVSLINNCDKESLLYLYSKVVPAVYHWIITHCHVAEWRAIVRDETLLQHVSAFLRKIVTHLSSQNESIYPAAFTKYCVSLYLDGDCTCIEDVKKFTRSPSNQEFSPLQPGEDAIYTCLLTPVLCSAPVKVDIPRGREFIDRLSALVETLTDSTAHTHAVKCLAGLVNKWKNEEELASVLERIKAYVENTLQSESGRDRKSLAVQYWSWITKALVLRNHRQTAHFTDKLIDLLADLSVGCKAASGIATILTPCEDVMTKKMSANIRIMYRQRFFMENLPKIAKGFESSTPETKKNYLLAASHLIKDMEKQILMPELQKVFPLLIHSLQYEDVDLQLSTMLTLSDLIENAPELVHKQMDSLIPKLLKLTSYKSSMKVRIAALKCIEEMTSLPLHIIIPYRGQITKALEPALDDPKRLVRKQAVSARQEWYLLDMKSK